MNVDDNPFITNRPSTRVKHAPGGDSSLSFGNYGSKTEESSNTSGRNNNNDFNKDRQRQRESQVTSSSNQNKNEQNKGERKAAGNLDTNRTNDQNDKRTNVKVNQPPGGASSIIFG